MIITNTTYNDMFNSVAREFVGRVELLEGSTLIDVFEHDGALIDFTIEKTGDNTKFFGYGICQKAIVKLRDKNREINAVKGQVLQIAHGIGQDYIYTHPGFYIEEIARDEKTGELTLTAYDKIYKANTLKVNDVRFPEAEFTLRTVAYAAASCLGVPLAFINISAWPMSLTYHRNTVNFGGNESLRELLDDIAEMLGAVYYISNNWELTFQRLDTVNSAVAVINKTKYFDLTAKTALTLENLYYATQLGDNYSATSGNPGETQIIRDNAFLTLRKDAYEQFKKIHADVKGLTICQFECKHRGDFRMEIGDKVSIEAKDGSYIATYVLDDSITYNGGLVGTMRWEYDGSDEEDKSQPTTLGEALKETFAKVDRANQEITLLASLVTETTEDMTEITKDMSELKVTTDAINARVSSTQTTLDETNDKLKELENSVEATLDPDSLSIMVNSRVDSVTTTTGFTFNASGLTISNSEAPTSTNVNTDGMKISGINSETLLDINNAGVTAKNLTADQYLIISNYVRFQKFLDANNNVRIGCFWLGGATPGVRPL